MGRCDEQRKHTMRSGCGKGWLKATEGWEDGGIKRRGIKLEEKKKKWCLKMLSGVF